MYSESLLHTYILNNQIYFYILNLFMFFFKLPPQPCIYPSGIRTHYPQLQSPHWLSETIPLELSICFLDVCGQHRPNVLLKSSACPLISTACRSTPAVRLKSLSELPGKSFFWRIQNVFVITPANAQV
jgi:hypothetical protein